MNKKTYIASALLTALSIAANAQAKVESGSDGESMANDKASECVCSCSPHCAEGLTSKETKTWVKLCEKIKKNKKAAK